MSVSPPPAKRGADICDAKAFLKGLRSISLRNLSVMKTVPGVGKVTGERDSTSISSTSLPRLRASILLNEKDATAAAKGDGRKSPPPKPGVGELLLTTGISQPTVNPTWPVSDTSWLRADVGADELENARMLLLRVSAVETCLGTEGDPTLRKDPSISSLGLGRRRRIEDDAGQALWDCVIDVRGLTALPAGSRLSHLWTLPADCVLVEMSNGGIYAPEWVVQALESNSALPSAVEGSRGGSGGDAWRDESDEDEDEGQEPVEEVLRKVLLLEKEADRGRAELAACLEEAAAGEMRVFEDAKSAGVLERLRLERSTQEELLEEEEALLEKERRHLQAESLAVEHLLTEFAAAEEAVELDARELESEKRETLKSHVLLEARKARLTAELQAIYPIKYHETLGEYTIRGLELPSDLYSVDDEKVSSALGYTAHLVCMLAKYLQVPLRYQLIYNASRSAVRDNITGAGVAYPLFRRGVEKERFDRGVFLLGRDVEQMLAARGVPVKRGRGELLRNLERLMAVEGA